MSAPLRLTELKAILTKQKRIALWFCLVTMFIFGLLVIWHPETIWPILIALAILLFFLVIPYVCLRKKYQKYNLFTKQFSQSPQLWAFFCDDFDEAQPFGRAIKMSEHYLYVYQKGSPELIAYPIKELVWAYALTIKGKPPLVLVTHEKITYSIQLVNGKDKVSIPALIEQELIRRKPTLFIGYNKENRDRYWHHFVDMCHQAG